MTTLEPPYRGVLLVGTICAGKTTIAAAIKTNLGVDFRKSVVCPLANKLKSLATELYGMDSQKKDRVLLQTLGKSLRNIDPDVFVNYVLKERIKYETDVIFIVDDGRYLNELRKFKAANFLIIGLRVDEAIRMARIKSLYPDITPEALQHESEKIWEQPETAELCDAIFDNNTFEEGTETVQRISKMLL